MTVINEPGGEERKPIEFDKNDQVQDHLMQGEKTFGDVSTQNRHRKSAEQKSGDFRQDNIQLPPHPLLGIQKYDGLADGESIPQNNIDTKLEILDNLEAHPELVNKPELRMALENRKANELVRSHSASPELKAG